MVTHDRHQASPLKVIQKILKDYFFAVVIAAAIALALRVYVIEAFRIPSDFMAPGLLAGDHIFVNKVAYVPFFGEKSPARGDIVIFSLINDPTKDYIKRVIAVAGDTIEIRGGHIVLNSKQVGYPVAGLPDLDQEEIGNHKYEALWKGISHDSRKLMPLTVPVGEMFVLGDNRSKGQDSRIWGFLSTTLVKGKASLVWFSSASVAGESKGILGIRWSRVLKVVN